MARLAIAVLTAVSSSHIAAQTESPLPITNRSPFTAVVGLPDARGGTLLRHDASQLEATLDISNTSIVDASANRLTTIDGETHRLNLHMARGIGDDWELGLTLPLLHHGGGFLDQPIETWHDIFSLPNGNRDRLPRDRLLYAYTEGQTRLFSLTESAGGIGDLQLHVARQLGEGLALRVSAKLPTGSERRLTGNGSPALAIGLHSSRPVGDALAWHGSIGGLFTHTNSDEILGGRARPALAYASTTLSWSIGPAIILKTQLDAHSAPYRRTGAPLNEASLMLSFAAAFALSDSWALEVGFSEDLLVESAPDIVFHAGLRTRF
jgi:hypothetical protein